ncbi:MAG: hypothetical protein IJ428_06120 [Clostridia bacterium]|nr:hypothetical protein [Clostridia bacterium]
MQNEQSSVMAVFETVARCGEISRAQLSSMTGFSQVTVGKAVELLCSCGILTEHKQSRGSVGRKSGICSLTDNCGMLLYDLTGVKRRVRVCDLALNIRSEYETEETEITSLALSGFAHFIEAFGGELLGIGCVTAGNDAAEYAKGFTEALGHAPELIIEESRAYAAANSARLDTSGVALLVRLGSDGSVDGAVTFSGRLYSGAHGKAGDFARAADSRESLISLLSNLCAVIDPETVHVSCEHEDDCDVISEELHARLAMSGLDAEMMPQIITEPLGICRSALDGVAALLRERCILSKLSKNT